MSVVTSRSQVRTYSPSRMSSLFGTPSAPMDRASRYNERMNAFNRVVRTATVKKPTDSPSSSRRSSIAPSEWKRAREHTERMRKQIAIPSTPRRTSTAISEVQKIIANLNRVKTLLESSP